MNQEPTETSRQQPTFPDANLASDEQTTFMYIVTGVVIDPAGRTQGRQFLLMTENKEDAEEYRDTHKALFPDGPYTSLMFGRPQIREIKIIKCPVVG